MATRKQTQPPKADETPKAPEAVVSNVGEAHEPKREEKVEKTGEFTIRSY